MKSIKLCDFFNIWHYDADLAIFITDQDGNILAREYSCQFLTDKDWVITEIGSYDFGVYGTNQDHAVHIQVIIPEGTVIDYLNEED